MRRRFSITTTTVAMEAVKDVSFSFKYRCVCNICDTVPRYDGMKKIEDVREKRNEEDQ